MNRSDKREAGLRRFVNQTTALSDDLSWNHGEMVALNIQGQLAAFMRLATAATPPNPSELVRQGAILEGMAQQLAQWTRNFEKGYVRYGD